LVECKVVELGAAWVRVVIVNHNAGPLLQNCIDALAAQSLADFEAIIVDNDSSDSSAEALRLPDGRFRLHLARANLGFDAANNFGAADCEAPWLATLNPDTVAQRHFAPPGRQDVRLDPAGCAEARSRGRLRRRLFRLRHGVARGIGLARQRVAPR
jgi:GT2 family glycosyltransferase